MNKAKFLKLVNISRKRRFIQVFFIPVASIIFFIISRISKLIYKPLKLSTSTFWGSRISGYIPDPSFSSIYLYKFSDEGLTHMLMQRIKRNDVFIDIGAHIGYETLLASKLVGNKGRVFSFEPTPSTYRLLCQNTSNLENVIINNLAVWSASKILTLFDYGQFYSGLNGFFDPRIDRKDYSKLQPKRIKVPAISFDEYCNTYQIKPTLIKVDAESAEYDILIGMKKILKQFKPDVILEIGDTPSEAGKTRKCLEFLTRLGYKVYEHNNQTIVKHQVRKNYLNVYDNLLFINKL